MKQGRLELLVGIFVLLGIAAVAVQFWLFAETNS